MQKVWSVFSTNWWTDLGLAIYHFFVSSPIIPNKILLILYLFWLQVWNSNCKFRIHAWESGIIWLYDGVGDFWRRYNREGVHDSIGVFFPDFGDKKRAHARAGATAKRVRKLKALVEKCFLFESEFSLPGGSRMIQPLYGRHPELSRPTLRLLYSDLWPSCCPHRIARRRSCRGGRCGRRDQNALSPSFLALSRQGPRAAHIWIGLGKVIAIRYLLAASRLVVVHVDALQLEIAVSIVWAFGINSMLVRDNFPELKNKFV